MIFVAGYLLVYAVKLPCLCTRQKDGHFVSDKSVLDGCRKNWSVCDFSACYPERFFLELGYGACAQRDLTVLVAV